MKKKSRLLSILLIIGMLFSIPVSAVSAVSSPDDNTEYEPENPGVQPEQIDVGDKGMVVSAHPLASEIGADVLKRGGNAVDAAVAIQFALNVAEPMMSGIGGGGFMMYYDAQTEDVSIINSRERAPQGATPDMFIDKSNIVEEPGKFLLGANELSDEVGNEFHVAEVQVEDVGTGEHVFSSDFTGENGAPWDADKFELLERGTAFRLNEAGGNIYFGAPYGSNSTSFGQATSVMESVEDSELFIRFRTDDPGDDRRLRLWLRADAFRSTGSTYARNGYGVEINTNTSELKLIQAKDGQNSTLDTVSFDRTTDWQSLRFRVEDDELKVRQWEENEEEPEEWDIEAIAGTVIPFSERVQSGKSVGVPGTLKGLETALDNWGSIPMEDLIQPSIDMAEQGIPVNWVLANAIASNESKLARTAAGDVFLPGGNPLEEGDTLVQEDLAKTFKLIRDQGSDALFNGEIGEALATEVQAFGGSMVTADLSRYDVTEDEPVWGDYQGYDIASMPPPSSGGLTMLQLLKMFEQLDLTQHDVKSPLKYHYMAEAMHLAYADRGAYMGDPEYVEVPREGLLDPDYVAERVATIHPEAANPNVEPGNPWDYQDGEAPEVVTQVDDKVDGETTHFTVADQWGNLVSYTTTIEQVFGSGIMVPGYGIMLNNELTDFDAIPGGANEVQPNKRPLSSMTPSIVLQDGEPYMTVGSPGGATIITSVTQTLVNVLGYEMELKDAIEEPRIYSSSYPSIRWEYGVPENIRDLLEQMGHSWEETPREIGNVNSILLHDETYSGAADSTREGTAIGISAEDLPSISKLKQLVAQFADNGEINNEQTERLLLTHLTAVERFANQDRLDKASKHMEVLTQLLDVQHDNGKISEQAKEELTQHAEALLLIWQKARN
ncbi:gamma-glutamyltransferase [Oceanobacillus sp. GSFE11]|uniref:Gamma-glutamyltransferase n=1 Tax=Oceanobacillus jordanicus TaxID=2867266 RepID=A0AAW5B6K0_9BACI|nr:gamma-glutamyltransferase [Oceanobacillus jordanicus]MCG3420293.1 gamma-glutamyltransferase [Oceanobacillus jordanicus]